MADSEKPTINVRSDELALLDKIRRLAPRFDVPEQRAEIYGVWTICYHRFCEKQDIPPVWMESVSEFMDFLKTQTHLSKPERNQALDAVMFYLTDIRRAEDQDEADSVESFPHPSTSRSLFAHLLLRCNIDVEQALALRAEDVDLDRATLRISNSDSSRVVQLLPSLRAGMRDHVKRVRRRTDAPNPRLFGPEAPESASIPVPLTKDVGDDDVEHATQVVTQVMKTLNMRPPSSPTGETASRPKTDS